jgi:hypothetical protein
MFFQDQLGAFAKPEAIANWLWEDLCAEMAT